MIDMAQNFGQGGAKLPDQDVGGLRSLLTELRGFRVSFAEGSAAAGSADLVPSVTVDAVRDSLLAVFSVNATTGSGGSLAHVAIAGGSCALVSGSTGNFYCKEAHENKGLMVFWYDSDNAEIDG